MTTDLPDPHGCHVCGSPRFASYNGVVRCASCNWARDSAEPGCPVRNAVCIEADREMVDELHAFFDACLNLGVAEETARERKVHGGGPRVITHDLDTGETWGGR